MDRPQALRPKTQRSSPLLVWIQMLWIQRQLARVSLKRRPAMRQPEPLHFLRRHLVLVWLISWAMLAGATTAAITTLMNPNASAPSKSVPQPNPVVGSVPRLAPPRSAPSLNLKPPSSTRSPALSPARRPASFVSTVGALLLSCVAGCFTLSRCLTLRLSAQTNLQKQQRPDLAGKSLHQPLLNRSVTAAPIQKPASEQSAYQSAHQSVSEPEDFPQTPAAQRPTEAASDLPESTSNKLI